MSNQYHPDSFLRRKLGPESRLLLYCAHTEVGPTEAEHIKNLARLPLDWERLCSSAEKHHLTQLLFRNLSAICPESIPSDTRVCLRHQFHHHAGSNLRLASELTNLLRTFKAEAIPVIPFKGSILANCTYGKLALRQYYDADLFISERDIEKSRQMLEREGFVCDEVFDCAARYQHPEKNVEIDLHWGFAPRYFHLNDDFDKLFVRARTESLLDQAVITFSAEDFLKILCLQLIKDCWERRQQLEHLSKLCDIAEHLRAHPEIQWTRVFESAKRDGLQRILHCALILARELLGADFPPGVLKKLECDHKARKCARSICRKLFTSSDTTSPLSNPYLFIGLRFRQLCFYLSVRERFRDRIKHVGEIFMIHRLART